MLYLPGGGAMLFLTDVDHVSFEKANETRQINLQSATVSLQVVIGLCRRKETAALKIKAAVSNGRVMICPLSSRQVKYLKVSDKNTYISFWSVGIFMHTISLYIF